MTDKSYIENIKMVCEIIALLSAAGFFIFKAYSGAFYVSLSLDLDTDKRKKLNDKEDALIIDLTLTGGENALLDIYKVQGKIKYDLFEEVFDFEGAERLTVNSIDNELKIVQPWTVYKGEKYRISVKEATSFAKKLIVPNTAFCNIEVIVVGSRKKFITKKLTISQWRLSHISLPN